MINSRMRLYSYIHNVKYVLNNLKIISNQNNINRLLNLVKAYVADAEYYLNKGDYYTGIACISYAEGILDAMKELGLLDFNWPKKRPTLPKVFVAGTFDILHPGHIYLLKKAWELGEVHVVVARDKNVMKFKGRKPIIPERQRLEMIRNIKWVDHAYLGDEDDIIKAIERIRPDIILLGPDQPIDEKRLANMLKERGLHDIHIIRLSHLYNDLPLTKTRDIIRKIIDMLKENPNYY